MTQRVSKAVLQSRQSGLFPPRQSGLLSPQSTHEPLLPEASATSTLTIPETVFNLANIVMGVGVLSVPYALKQSGYFALILVFLVIAVTTKTAKWVGSALELLSERSEAARLPSSSWDFAFLAEVAFGSKVAVLISVVTVLEVWLALVTFMVMNGANTAILWPSVSSSVTIPVTGAIATLFCFIPSQVYSYLSLLSTLAMFCAAGAMVFSTYTMRTWAEPYEHMGDAALFNAHNIPRSIGIILFCFAGHPCFCAVKTTMQRPAKWGFSVDISFLIAFLYYASFGFLGYIVFGPMVSQSVATNIEDIKRATFWRDLAACCFLVKIQLTIPLLMNVVMVALYKPVGEKSEWPLPRVLILGVVSCATMVAAVLLADSLAIIASLAGSLFVMTTSVLFPPIVHLGLRWSSQGRKITICAWLEYSVVIVFGVVQGVLGTVCAFQDLLQAA